MKLTGQKIKHRLINGHMKLTLQRITSDKGQIELIS